MRRLLSVILDIGFILAALLCVPWLLYRMIVAKRYRFGWAWRFGLLPERREGRPAIWIHAVSMGEVNAMQTLVERLEQQMPWMEVFVTTTTDTGFERAVKLYGRDRVFFFPYDFSLAMWAAFRRLKPAMIILAELEVWPNLVMEAHRRKVPVVVVNGRVTERASDRYMIVGPLTKWLFSQLDLVMVQDNRYQQRFLALGVQPSRLMQTGSLKWDTARVDEATTNDASLDTMARALGIDRRAPLLVAGSTAELEATEEEAILRAFQQARIKHPTLQLAIVPRKPERFDAVAKLIKSRGFRVVRRSEHLDGTEIKPGESMTASPVILLDTMGELRRLYALSTIVLVGRTFVNLGGSDVMEIAALGKAMITGPSTHNFADAVNKLRDNEAIIQLESSEKIAGAIESLLKDRNAAAEMGRRAQQVVEQEQGATARTARQICKMMGYEYDVTERGCATPVLGKP